MKKNNKVARQLFIGAEIFQLVTKPVDANHKSKEKDLRIEKMAIICMPKALVVNEVKEVHVAGGATVIVVNGSADKASFPSNYKFANGSSDFDFEKNPDVYFPSYEEAIAIANASNESEIARLTEIRDDLNDQIKCLIDANKANIAALPLYEEEED